MSGFHAVHFEVLLVRGRGHPEFFAVLPVFRERELADAAVVPVRDPVVGGGVVHTGLRTGGGRGVLADCGRTVFEQ